jgi:hypothetical protein
MRKIYLKIGAVTMALLLLQAQLSAGVLNSANTTATFDAEVEVYDAFAEIESLVSFLNSNDEATYTELKAENSSLIENVSASAAIALNANEQDGPPALSAFWWGCLLSWVGVIVVYVTTDSNKEYTKGAWTGCLVNAGCNVLAGIGYYVMLFAVYGGTWGY